MGTDCAIGAGNAPSVEVTGASATLSSFFSSSSSNRPRNFAWFICRSIAIGIGSGVL